MSQVDLGSIHKFLTGETVTGDDTQVATSINIAFETLRRAHNDTDTKVNNNYTKAQTDAALGVRDSAIAQLGVGQIPAVPGGVPIPVSLANGLQVLNNLQTSPLDNVQVKGNTLINLIGRDGNCEDVNKFFAYQATIANDTSNFSNGTKSVKVTISATFTSGAGATLSVVTLSPTKYYVMAAMIKNGTASTGGSVSISGQFATTKSNTISDSTKFNLSYKTLFGITASNLSVNINAEGAAGQYVYGDEMRIYEITAAEKTYIDGLSVAAAQAYIAAKYPYVDDVKSINAPVVTKYGENLLPPFSDWTNQVSTIDTVTAPYTLTKVANALGQLSTVNVPAIAGQVYTLTYICNDNVNGYMNIRWVDANGNTLGYTPQPSGSQTVTAPAGTVIAQVLATQLIAGTFTYDQPRLNIGSVDKGFKPRNDDMLAFPNVQLASSLDGTVYDTLFERDGKFFVENRFKKDFVLDGSLIPNNVTDFTGFKQVKLPLGSTNVVNNSEVITKYNGNILSNVGAGWDRADKSQVYNDGYIYLTIADTDSGWGETYTPSAAEIQAYFNGWRMRDAATTAPYTSGIKSWGTIASGATAQFTQTNVPTVPTNVFTPYKLTYQLATPTFEEIQAEGSLALHEGLNQIEVGQGVIVREKANPQLNSGFALINVTTLPSSQLKNRTSKILSVYKNGKNDSNWVHSAVTAYGNDRLYTDQNNYDSTAIYEVSYTALDQYLLSTNVQAVTGETAANLKTLGDSLAIQAADQESRIAANEQLARQIYNVPQKTIANMTLYVDGTNGADSNDGSASKPLKTIMAAVRRIPQVVNHNYTIFVAAGTYAESIILNGFIGGGSVTVQGDTTTPTNVNVTNVDINLCQANVSVRGFNFTTTTLNALSAVSCNYVDFSNNACTAASANYGTYAARSRVFINGGTISNRGTAIYADYSSMISCYNCGGTGNTTGLASLNGSHLTYYASKPSGTTPTYVDSGGMLVPTLGVNSPWGDNTQSIRSRASLTSNATQNISAATATKVSFQVASIDNLGEASLGGRFTASKAGVYDVKGTILFSSGMGTTVSYAVNLYKNGVLSRFMHTNNGTTHTAPIVPFVYSMDLVAGDYIEVYIQTSGATVLATGSSFEITRIA